MSRSSRWTENRSTTCGRARSPSPRLAPGSRASSAIAPASAAASPAGTQAARSRAGRPRRRRRPRSRQPPSRRQRPRSAKPACPRCRSSAGQVRGGRDRPHVAAIAGEVHVIRDAELGGLCLQLGTQLAVADDRQPDGRAVRRGPRRRRHSSTSTRLIGTRRPTNVSNTSSSAAAGLGSELRPVRPGQRGERLEVEADRDHAEPFSAARHAGAPDRRPSHGLRRPGRSLKRAERPLDRAVEGVAQRSEVALEDMPVVGVDDQRAGPALPSIAARRPSMPAFAVCVWTMSGRKRPDVRGSGRSAPARRRAGAARAAVRAPSRAWRRGGRRRRRARPRRPPPCRAGEVSRSARDRAGR